MLEYHISLFKDKKEYIGETIIAEDGTFICYTNNKFLVHKFDISYWDLNYNILELFLQNVDENKFKEITLKEWWKININNLDIAHKLLKNSVNIFTKLVFPLLKDALNKKEYRIYNCIGRNNV